MKKVWIRNLVLVVLICAFAVNAAYPTIVSPSRTNHWVFDLFGESGFQLYVRVFSIFMMVICALPLLLRRRTNPKIDAYLRTRNGGSKFPYERD